MTKSCDVDVSGMTDEDVEAWEDRADRLREETALSPREAEVRALKDVGLSHEEVAERIGSSKSAVDNYSLRIRDKLVTARATVDLLDDEEPEEDAGGDPDDVDEDGEVAV